MWKKIIAPTILVSIVWLAGSVISTYYIQRVYRSHSRVLSEDVSTIRAGWAMRNALWKIQAVVMEAGGKDLAKTRAEVEELESAFLRQLAEAERTSVAPDELAMVATIRENFSSYQRHIDASLRRSVAASAPAQPNGDNAKSLRPVRDVADSCRALVELNEQTLLDSSERNARLGSLTTIIRLAFLIAGPILGVLYGLWVARGLNRSISQISVTLKDVAGASDHELGSVEVRAQGDFPQLQQQVQMVAGRMRQVMEELQQSRHKAMSTERLAAVGELAAGIAHELRNPLTSVKLLVQTAQRQVRQEPAGQQLQVVQQEISRLEGTIQALLDFARPPKLAPRAARSAHHGAPRTEPGRRPRKTTGRRDCRATAEARCYRGRRSRTAPSDICQSVA